MKLKNKQVKSVVSALFNLGNRNSIKLKWELTKYSKAFVEADALINNEVNAIIEKEGVVKDNKGAKSIEINNASYLALMDLDIDINADKLTLDQLADYNPTMNELLALEAIIQEE